MNPSPGNFRSVSRSIFDSFIFYSSWFHFFFTLIIPKTSRYIVSKVMPVCVDRIGDQEGSDTMANTVTHLLVLFTCISWGGGHFKIKCNRWPLFFWCRSKIFSFFNFKINKSPARHNIYLPRIRRPRNHIGVALVLYTS